MAYQNENGATGPRLSGDSQQVTYTRSRMTAMPPSKSTTNFEWRSSQAP
jgi:hypothetical protein